MNDSNSLIPRYSPDVFDDVMDLDVVKVKNYMAAIPSASRRLLGCENCEWKNTKECPSKNKSEFPKQGMCAKRAYFIASLTDGKKVSHSVLMRIYNSMMGQSTNMEDYKEYQDKKKIYLEKQAQYRRTYKNLEEKERKLEKSILNDYKKDYLDARANWFSLWDKNMTYIDRKLDRDSRENTVKELSVMGLNDIHRIMRGDIIDAETEDN